MFTLHGFSDDYRCISRSAVIMMLKSTHDALLLLSQPFLLSSSGYELPTKLADLLLKRGVLRLPLASAHL